MRNGIVIIDMMFVMALIVLIVVTFIKFMFVEKNFYQLCISTTTAICIGSSLGIMNRIENKRNKEQNNVE